MTGVALNYTTSCGRLKQPDKQKLFRELWSRYRVQPSASCRGRRRSECTRRSELAVPMRRTADHPTTQSIPSANNPM